MCCSLSLCETCQTYVLKVQIWVWKLQLLPVLVLCPFIWGSQLNRLRIRVPFQEGLPQCRQKFKQYQLWLRLFRGSKRYIEDFTELTTLWAYLKRYNACLGTDADSWLESSSFGGNYYFCRWMAWTWDKGKEGTRNSPPPYCETSSSHNWATLPDVLLKDLSKCTVRL